MYVEAAAAFAVVVVGTVAVVVVVAASCCLSSISDRCAARIAAKLPSSIACTAAMTAMSVSSLGDADENADDDDDDEASPMIACSLPYPTYTRASAPKSWLLATVTPMKNPTAMELWNLRIIMVPPTDRQQSRTADQKLQKPSLAGLLPMTAKLMSMSAAVMAKIEYLIVPLYRGYSIGMNVYDTG